MVELRHLLALAARRWWLLALCVGAALAGAALLTAATPQAYQATASVLYTPGSATASYLFRTTQEADLMGETLVHLLSRDTVLQRALDRLEVDMAPGALRPWVSARRLPGTQIIEVTATAADPQFAVDIARAMADSFVEETNTVFYQKLVEAQADIAQEMGETQRHLFALQESLGQLPPQGQRSAEQEEAARRLQAELTQAQSTYDRLLTAYENLVVLRGTSTSVASPLEHPVTASAVSQRRVFTFGVALLGGLLAGLSGAWLLGLGDQGMRNLEAAAGQMGLARLTVVPPLRRPRRGQDTRPEFTPTPLHAFYQALARLGARDGRLPASVLVTSAGHGEGKSTTARGLAFAAAQTGRQVLLADAHLLRPTVHLAFQRPLAPGLWERVTGHPAGEGMLQESGVPNLRLLTAGDARGEVSTVLTPEALEALLARLGEEADLVVVDAPPVFGGLDAAALAAAAEATLVVVNPQATTSRRLWECITELWQRGAEVAGVVENRVRRPVATLAHPPQRGAQGRPRPVAER